MKTEQILQDLTERLCAALVDDPGGFAVRVCTLIEDPVFRIEVQRHEIAKLIGKQGQMANSIRILVKSCGKKHGFKCYVEIVESEADGEQLANG